MSRQIIQPLTRVEGHGRVILEQQQGRLVSVQLDLNESPRLFEALLVGRSWQEVPELVCRICGICSSVHKLAALHALEQVLKINIPPAAAIVRELTLLGGHIQSHALHLFCLILPDFFGVPSVLDLARDRHPLAMAGLEVKAFGNRLQELFGGRIVHPVNLVIGGIGQCPAEEQLIPLKEELAALCEKWPAIAEEFQASAKYPAGGAPVGCSLATGSPIGFDLTGTSLWTADGSEWPVADYARLLAERPVSSSHAKWPTGEQGPFLVGALARQALTARRTGTAPDTSRQNGIYANNTAQLLEIDWALSRAYSLACQLLDLDKTAPCRIPPDGPRAGVGIAAFEAPRGLLVHRYILDDTGHVTEADIVTPTAINQQVMAKQICLDLAEEKDQVRIVKTAEQIVRAYDPCISCAVHLLEVK